MNFLRTTITVARLAIFLTLLGFLSISCDEIGEPEVVKPLPPVAPEAEVSLKIEVRSSASVSYQWETDGRGGEIISDPTRSAITWQAPQKPGLYNIFIQVTINGVKTQKSVAIEVAGTPIAAVSSSPTLTQTPSPAPSTDTPTPTETPIPPTDTPTLTPTPTNTPIPPPTPTFTSIPPDTPTPTPILPTLIPASPTNTPISATPISCLSANITSPAGADQEGEVGGFHVSNPVTISWEPASCNLVIQYYQLGHCYAVGSDGCIPGQPAVASGVQVTIPPGTTEIKIWHAGQVTDNTWVSVD